MLTRQLPTMLTNMMLKNAQTETENSTNTHIYLHEAAVSLVNFGPTLAYI